MRLSDIDLNSSHLAVALAAAGTAWYIRPRYDERRREERRLETELLMRTIAQTVRDELRNYREEK